jgi:hypothetical protein
MLGLAENKINGEGAQYLADLLQKNEVNERAH